ncbi:MAG TPA: hypothetical protein EYQ24_14260 [Bacteroidetes bacterium]|nr:hypothetical protein [Bacteroidota bacterium]HIL56585.1 hypothetical protein [Rhodothermales bacterium]
MADINWILVILGTTAGFFLLAFVLLYPVYRFMRREEDVAQDWTKESIARRQQRRGGDGASAPPPPAGGTSGEA